MYRLSVGALRHYELLSCVQQLFVAQKPALRYNRPVIYYAGKKREQMRDHHIDLCGQIDFTRTEAMPLLARDAHFSFACNAPQVKA